MQSRLFGPWLAVAALGVPDGEGFDAAAREAMKAGSASGGVHGWITEALKAPLRGKGDVAATRPTATQTGQANRTA